MVSIIVILASLKLINIEFEYIYQEKIPEINKLSFVLILSIIISHLIILITSNKYDYRNLIKLPFLTIGIFIINYIIISEYDYKKFDYLISKKIEKINFEKYNDEGKNITKISNEKDTLFYHRYPIIEGEYNFYKSRLNKYYYLIKK